MMAESVMLFCGRTDSQKDAARVVSILSRVKRRSELEGRIGPVEVFVIDNQFVICAVPPDVTHDSILAAFDSSNKLDDDKSMCEEEVEDDHEKEKRDESSHHLWHLHKLWAQLVIQFDLESTLAEILSNDVNLSAVTVIELDMTTATLWVSNANGRTQVEASGPLLQNDSLGVSQGREWEGDATKSTSSGLLNMEDSSERRSNIDESSAADTQIYGTNPFASDVDEDIIVSLRPSNALVVSTPQEQEQSPGDFDFANRLTAFFFKAADKVPALAPSGLALSRSPLSLLVPTSGDHAGYRGQPIAASSSKGGPPNRIPAATASPSESQMHFVETISTEVEQGKEMRQRHIQLRKRPLRADEILVKSQSGKSLRGYILRHTTGPTASSEMGSIGESIDSLVAQLRFIESTGNADALDLHICESVLMQHGSFPRGLRARIWRAIASKRLGWTEQVFVHQIELANCLLQAVNGDTKQGGEAGDDSCRPPGDKPSSDGSEQASNVKFAEPLPPTGQTNDDSHLLPDPAATLNDNERSSGAPLAEQGLAAFDADVPVVVQGRSDAEHTPKAVPVGISRSTEAVERPLLVGDARLDKKRHSPLHSLLDQLERDLPRCHAYRSTRTDLRSIQRVLVAWQTFDLKEFASDGIDIEKLLSLCDLQEESALGLAIDTGDQATTLRQGESMFVGPTAKLLTQVDANQLDVDVNKYSSMGEMEPVKGRDGELSPILPGLMLDHDREPSPDGNGRSNLKEDVKSGLNPFAEELRLECETAPTSSHMRDVVEDELNPTIIQSTLEENGPEWGIARAVEEEPYGGTKTTPSKRGEKRPLDECIEELPSHVLFARRRPDHTDRADISINMDNFDQEDFRPMNADHVVEEDDHKNADDIYSDTLPQPNESIVNTERYTEDGLIPGSINAANVSSSLPCTHEENLLSDGHSDEPVKVSQSAIELDKHDSSTKGMSSMPRPSSTVSDASKKTGWRKGSDFKDITLGKRRAYWQGMDSLALALLEGSALDEVACLGLLNVISELAYDGTVFMSRDSDAELALMGVETMRFLGFVAPALASHVTQALEGINIAYACLGWYIAVFAHALPIKSALSGDAVVNALDWILTGSLRIPQLVACVLVKLEPALATCVSFDQVKHVLQSGLSHDILSQALELFAALKRHVLAGGNQEQSILDLTSRFDLAVLARPEAVESRRIVIDLASHSSITGEEWRLVFKKELLRGLDIDKDGDIIFKQAIDMTKQNASLVIVRAFKDDADLAVAIGRALMNLRVPFVCMELV